MKRLILLLAVLLLAGCDVIRGLPRPQDLLPGLYPSATPTRVLTSTPAPPATVTVPGQPPTHTPTPGLILWVPPEFDPDNGSPASTLLRRRLDEFSRLNSGVRITVRVKAAAGPGGLLEALSAASSAAPGALPSVVALSRDDLESAALKGLIFALDGASQTINQTDWYAYARALAQVQGSTFSLPFAGDALVLAYRPAKINLNTPLADWPTLLRMNQPLGFPAGDAQALFLLSLYRSVGGPVEDTQHRPALQADKLSQVLQVFSDGEQRGVFPYWLSQYETGGQVWQAYRDGRINAVVAWASDYLSNLPPDTNAVPIPPLAEPAQTLATGWGWAVADPVPERRGVAVRLAEFLAQGEFLAQWSEAAGYLPTRPSALAAWKNQNLKALLSQVTIAAQARPTTDEITSLGPVLKDALLKVLKRENEPTQAAKAASEKLTAPEIK